MAVAVDEFQLLLVQLAADLDIKLDRLVAAVADRTQREVLTYISAAYPELMDRYLAAVGDLSATYYEDQPGGSPGFIAQPADPQPQARLAASGRWAMLQSVPRTALSGASTRFLFEHSRTTIVGNAAREDVPWARHASANACGFCRMLATRGTVYGGAATAKRSHNNCHCIAVPDRDGTYRPAPYVAQWEKDYKAARKAGATTPNEIARAMDLGRGKFSSAGIKLKSTETPAPATAPAGDRGGGTPPPVDNRPIATGDEDPRDRLDRIFAQQTADATAEQRLAVQRWQGNDRYYEKIQEATAGDGELEAMTVVRNLSKLARPIPSELKVWRGIRSTKSAFGVTPENLGELIGRTWTEERFLATTLDRGVATPEFTHPGSGPAILLITVRPGARAVWIPPLGYQEFAAQSELLFTPGIGVRILGVDSSGELPVIEVEVMSGEQVR